jgi:hypothetical protein
MDCTTPPALARTTRTLAHLAALAAALGLVGCADGRSRARGAEPPGTSTMPSMYADAGAGRADAGYGGGTADAGTWGGAPDAYAARPDAAEPPPPTVLPGVPALRCGRTYDHETTYLLRGGEPDFATLRHRDGTSLPADEGGASCGGSGGCTENVTLLCDGDSLTGVLENATSFSVQGALSAEPGTGSLVITLCGEDLAPMPYAAPGTTLPGFINNPQPAATVPTRDRCEVRVRATGGCVWVRAVTVTCPDPGTSPNQPS